MCENGIFPTSYSPASMEITMNADWSTKLQWQQSGRQKALSWGFCLNISNQDVIMQSQQKGFVSQVPRT